MKKCVICHKDNVDTAKFCGYCGCKFDSFICHKCDHENNYGVYCSECGTLHVQNESSIVIIDKNVSTNLSDYQSFEVDVDNDTNVYSYDGKVLLDGGQKRKHVKIQDGCEVICDKVYYARGEVRILEDVYIPDSIKIIGNNAFDSQILAKIRIPSCLTEIREEAFYRINAFPHELDLSHTKLEVIRKNAFLYSSVHSLILPDTIEYIEFPITWGMIRLKVSEKSYLKIQKQVFQYHKQQREKFPPPYYPTAKVEVV